MTGEELEKVRKAKKYLQPKEQTLRRCNACKTFDFDETNVRQRMSSVGVCRVDGTPADSTFTCKLWEQKCPTSSASAPAGA